MNIKFACWSIAAGLALISATCVAAGKDELWEITNKMEMEGMPFAMPAQTSKVCIPKGQEKDPNKSVPNDENCKMSDVKVSGNKMSWKMKCEGKDAMSGSGEMVYGEGTYSGKMKMHSEDGDMVMAYDGKRIGSCDVGEEKEKMLAPMKAMLAEQRADCKKLLDKGGVELIEGYHIFTLQGTACNDMKKTMCDKGRAQSSEYAVYDALVQNEKNAAAMRKQVGAEAPKALVAECGFDMAKMTGVVCQKAKGDKKYGFIASKCPNEAQAMAKQHCESWGRDYTSDHDNVYAPICAKYSKNKSRYQVGDEAVDDAGTDAKKPQDSKTDKETGNPADSVLDGVEKLKGLFGF